MRRTLNFAAMAAVITALLAAALVAGNGTALADGRGLALEISPSAATTGVGDAVAFQVNVINEADTPTGGISIHIDITDPLKDGSVDPEDWVSELTRSIGPLAPGESRAETWSLSPISGGDFAFYAVALDHAAGIEVTAVSVSDAVPIHVEEKRSFNPQGVTPITIAVPLVIALALMWRRKMWPFNSCA